MSDISHSINNKVASVILAGGEGTRLKPLTQSRCKPAVSFAGRYRLIDVPLSNSLNSNIKRIYVISQYLAAGLHRHILETYPESIVAPGKIELLSSEISVVKNENYQGTADAVRKNLSIILQSPADYFLILSGDQLYNMDFSPLIEFAMEKDADLTIATQSIGETEASRMGLMKIDEQSNIIDFVEKPTQPKVLNEFALSGEFINNHGLSANGERQFLGSMGIYVFKRNALITILQEKGEDFGKHIIPKQLKKGKTVSYLYRGYWEDIGTIFSFYHANLALLNGKNSLDLYNEKNPIFSSKQHLPSPMIRNTLISNSLISHGTIIDAKEISNSIIGTRAQIGEGTVIKDSIVMGNQEIRHKDSSSLHIGKFCQIQKAIIDEFCHIGDHVKLLNRNNLQHYDGDGIYIRDGIIIVSHGTRLPDHFTL